tara:strand:+ start:415 stop:723 length:309 start_codon:yes stop_codon:yes gene_type:complete
VFGGGRNFSSLFLSDEDIMNMTDDQEFGAMMSLLGREETENLGMIIAGIAAAIGAVTYSCRHLKTSNCCGFSCTQVVTDAPTPAPVVICPDGKPGVALETQV